MKGRTNAAGSGLQIPLDAPVSLTATAGNAQVSLTWTDPKDKYATPAGEQAQDPQQLVSVWDHTRLVRKLGSAPAGPNDGTVVISSEVRNQHQSTPYVDTGLQNGATYFYAAFAYNEDFVVSPGAFSEGVTPLAGTPLSELAEGTLIKINENGAPVEFYVAKHNYEAELNGDGRTLVVRKYCESTQAFDAVSNGTGDWEYADSSLCAYLNGEYKNKFHPTVQSMMGSTKFKQGRYQPYNSNSTIQTEAAIFIPSAREITSSANSSWGNDGTLLPNWSIYCNAGFENGSSGYRKMTRTGGTSSFYNLVYVYDDGSYSNEQPRTAASVLPFFTLPNTAKVNENLLLMEE